MLAPHHREDAELGEVRLASEDALDARVFLRREAVLGDQFGRDGRVRSFLTTEDTENTEDNHKGDSS